MLKRQKGQTLIETVVAIFILVMGMTAAVGLALYAFGTSTSITKQIIATGLAREGIEAVKTMRDTNWLNDTLSNNCYSYVTSQNNGKCYKNWLNKKFCIDPTNNNGNCNGSAGNLNYYLGIDGSTQDVWDLVRQRNTDNYGLDFNSAVGNSGFYSPSNSTAGNSEYYRKISIEKDNTAPFDHSADLGPRLKVTVQVWWTDKKCPRSANWPGLGKCSLELKTNLTNWRDY